MPRNKSRSISRSKKTSTDQKEKLKLINKALQLFPKIVKEKERQWRARERDIKRFDQVSQQLLKIQEKDGFRHSTNVREHPRVVPPSLKNPFGVTIVDQHTRRIAGRTLSKEEILKLSQSVKAAFEFMPKKGRLPYKNADLFDELITFWTVYFKNELNAPKVIDPNIIKALIGSESSFNPKADNGIAIGLMQVTRSTFRILKNPKAESKEFIFNKLVLKDLKDPAISIALGTRWLYRKWDAARSKLARDPSADELVLEYKGLMKSKSEYKKKALKNFRTDYELLVN